VLKPEQPVCEEATAVTLSGLQKLELFTLFAKHFRVEIPVGFNPILVDFDRQCSDQSQRALLVGKDVDELGATLDFLVESLEHIGAFEMLVVLPRQPVSRRCRDEGMERKAAELVVPVLIA
jgi:hypothetical protein